MDNIVVPCFFDSQYLEWLYPYNVLKTCRFFGGQHVYKILVSVVKCPINLFRDTARYWSKITYFARHVLTAFTEDNSLDISRKYLL